MEKVSSKKLVAVAMSGGVDSSVTVKLLQEQGYEVVGITGKMFDTQKADKICENAKKVADLLGIEHYVLDISDEFQTEVIDYFENSYAKGETPNPCVICNSKIKWGKILDYAIDVLDADLFATGHYANIKCENGIYKLYPAIDTHKDQLYFLSKLTQEQLAKTIFPLSGYEKPQIKQMAIDFDLPPKDSKESQDICFISAPYTSKTYLLEKLGTKEGTFVEKSSGKILGKHQGAHFYTIGQRKGIGIAHPEPLYVIEIDTFQNIVYVGIQEQTFSSEVSVKDVILTYPLQMNVFEAMIKIRYNMQAVQGKVILSRNEISQKIEAKVEFLNPINSVTKGQSAVFYDLNDGHLIGSGWIV